MCVVILIFFQFNDDIVNNVVFNFVGFLIEVINKVVGFGSFGEGLFKLFLFVDMDIILLKEIGE